MGLSIMKEKICNALSREGWGLGVGGWVLTNNAGLFLLGGTVQYDIAG